MKLKENTDILLFEEGVYMKNRDLSSRCHVSVLCTKKYIFVLPGTFFKEYAHYFLIPVDGKMVDTNEPIGLIKKLLRQPYQNIDEFEAKMIEITSNGNYKFCFQLSKLKKCKIFGLFAAGLKITDEHNDNYIIGLNKRSNKAKYKEFHQIG